jgi:hypothetical protein
VFDARLGWKDLAQPGCSCRVHNRNHRAACERPADLRADVVLDGLNLNGSSGPAPFGVQNVVTLKANWPDPGFRGAFLPADRTVRDDGFEATWKVSYYGRDYPQRWTSRVGNERFTTLAVSNSLFGAQFLSVLDAYRYVERSIKYGVLFFVLVFTTFFLFEITARQKIHPSSTCRCGLVPLLSRPAIGPSYRVHAFMSSRQCGDGTDHLVLRHFGGGARNFIVGGGLIGVCILLYITLRCRLRSPWEPSRSLPAGGRDVRRKIDWHWRGTQTKMRRHAKESA